MQAAFFIAYVVTSGWTSLSSELCRLTPLLCNFAKRLFSRNDSDEFEVPSIPYYSEFPTILFFGLLGVTYFFLAPLILPFILVYYCLGYIIYRNQVSRVSLHSFFLYPIIELLSLIIKGSILLHFLICISRHDCYLAKWCFIKKLKVYFEL